MIMHQHCIAAIAMAGQERAGVRLPWQELQDMLRRLPVQARSPVFS